MGEMNPDQLRETTLNMETRTLRQITISDFEGSATLIEKLMGKSAEERRDFISENGHKVDLFI